MPPGNGSHRGLIRFVPCEVGNNMNRSKVNLNASIPIAVCFLEGETVAEGCKIKLLTVASN